MLGGCNQVARTGRHKQYHRIQHTQPALIPIQSAATVQYEYSHDDNVLLHRKCGKCCPGACLSLLFNNKLNYTDPLRVPIHAYQLDPSPRRTLLHIITTKLLHVRTQDSTQFNLTLVIKLILNGLHMLILVNKHFSCFICGILNF